MWFLINFIQNKSFTFALHLLSFSSLILFCSYAKTPFTLLFEEARAIILPMVINQLVWYLERMEDLQIIIDILNDLLTTLTKPPDLVVCSFHTYFRLHVFYKGMNK